MDQGRVRRDHVGRAPEQPAAYIGAVARTTQLDFVEARPFLADVIAAIAPVLRRLHALPPFVKVLDHQLAVIDGFIQRCRAAQLPVETSELFDRYAELAQVYPRVDDLVACHNDLKPQNTLFDGERFWLVDWEAAFLNDRYVGHMRSPRFAQALAAVRAG